MSNQRLYAYGNRLRAIGVPLLSIIVLCWAVVAATSLSAAAPADSFPEIAEAVTKYLETKGHDSLLHALVLLSGLCIIALILVAKAAYQIHRDVLRQSRESNDAVNKLAGRIHGLTDELSRRPCIFPGSQPQPHIFSAERDERRDERRDESNERSNYY